MLSFELAPWLRSMTSGHVEQLKTHKSELNTLCGYNGHSLEAFEA
jgi:hypothetical protein